MGLEYSSQKVNTFDNGDMHNVIIFPQIKSARRVYFHQILGRDPEKYEWHDKLTPHDYLRGLIEKYKDSQFQEGLIKPQTIGSLIVFPHISTDVFWGASDKETDLYKRVFRNMRKGDNNIDVVEIYSMNTSLGNDYIFNIGCPSQIIDHAIEVLRWSEAKTVPEYLFSDKIRIPELSQVVEGIDVRNPSKLKEFYKSREQQKKVFKNKGDKNILIIE